MFAAAVHKRHLRVAATLAVIVSYNWLLCGHHHEPLLIDGLPQGCQFQMRRRQGPLVRAAAESSESGMAAYNYWAEQFPVASKAQEFYKRPATAADISERFRRLRAALGAASPVGESFVLKLLAKDASVLFAPRPRATFLQLILELTGRTSQGRGTVMAALLEKPELLLLPPKALAKKGRSALDMNPTFPEELPPFEDEASYWDANKQGSRNIVLELGKVLKPIGGAKAVYPMALLILYAAAWTSQFLPHPPPE